MKKGQTAIEFFIMMGTALLFFISLLFVLSGNVSDRIKEKNNILINEAALIIQDEIFLARQSSDGYERNFNLPWDINGLEYEISLEGEFVYVKTTNENYAVALPVLNVTGQPQKGLNYIKNRNGEVYLNS